MKQCNYVEYNANLVVDDTDGCNLAVCAREEEGGGEEKEASTTSLRVCFSDG